MPLRSRLAIAVAAGALAFATAATPAVASDEGADDPALSSQEDLSQGGGFDQSAGGVDTQGDHRNQRLYKGRVTASTLALRSAPNRGSQIIRFAQRGDIVTIFCKTNGQSVQGNRHWYLLTDGTWAWGSARYIANIGPKPRWC
ncbi:SH3 domain-containing protein [Streptomyces sp. NPDC002838]|uniref:SH3 domain-containing protein n=1 Tax=Streptomyces sp. NPDC002838 TaxID=3154436 RepID=UPI00331EC781